MLKQTTLEDLPDTTFSPELAGGTTPYNSPDGQTTDLSVRQACPASRSATPENNLEKPTNGTCSRISSNLSEGLDLERYLASKSPERSSTAGWMIYAMKWSEKTTPSGRVYLQHQARVPRIFGNDCTGWRTPKANESEEDVNSVIARREARRIAGDTKTGNLFNLSQEAQISGWVSPTVTDANRGVKPPRPHDTGIPLTQQVGMIANGSTAETTSTGQLNPALSRWLQGFPEEWCVAAIQANRTMKQTKKVK